MKTQTKILTLKDLSRAAMVAVVVLAAIIGAHAAPPAGELDRSFKPSILANDETATIRDTVVQPDGKTIVVGTVLKINNQQVNHVARFNADGSLDATFDAGGAVARGFFGDVSVVALQPDGKIIVGGRFEQVARQTLYGLARLNADGSFDPSFNANLNSSQASVTAVTVQADGKILVGGGDIVFNTGTTTLTRRGIVRLNSDGSLDSAFNPFSVSTQINSIAVQADAKILVCGGTFTVGSQTRSQVARLNLDGSLDASFVGTTYDSTVFVVAPQANGKIYIGGAFNTVGGQTQERLGRLNADGTRDASFASASGNPFVKEIYTQSDGKIIYSADGGTAYRANPDGTRDVDFSTRSRVQTSAFKINVLPDDRVIVGGSSMQIRTTVGGFITETRNFVILAADGTLDDSVNPYVSYSGGGSYVNYLPTVIAQPDGKILYSSDAFFEVNRVARRHIVRLNADGSTDPTFNVATGVISNSSRVAAMALQADGKIVFSSAGASSSTDRQIARLSADGSLDASFSSVTINVSTSRGVVDSIAVQPNGQIVIRGSFTAINGQARDGIARLNADGSLDSFNPGVTNSFGSNIARGVTLVQTDGKFLIAGGRSTGSGGQFIARFNVDGSLDSSFVSPSETSSAARLLALQPDGKIIFQGLGFGIARLNPNGTADSSFSNVPGFSININTGGSVVAAVVMNNGKILIGGRFNFANLTTGGGIPRTGFARLNADGSLDTTYGINGGATVAGNGSNQGNNTAFVAAMALQPDGNALIAGNFQYVNNFSQHTLARLKTSAIGANNVSDFDGDGRTDTSVFRNGTWYINPSSNPTAFAPQGFYATQFGLATDKLVPADYDGDGKTDIAVWREGSLSYFYILNSSNNTFRSEQFGRTGDNPSVVGNWDSDGKADLAVYRNGAGGGQSFFFYRPSSQPGADFETIYWGAGGDESVRGDFDGDGRQDAAVFRPSTQSWYIRQSSNNQARYESWGAATDKRVSGDFDGDGKTDLAIFRDGLWAIKQSSNNQPRYEQFGQAGDRIVAGDYDGDGRTDLAVWRSGTYYIKQNGNAFAAVSFGAANDVPVASAFIQ